MKAILSGLLFFGILFSTSAVEGNMLEMKKSSPVVFSGALTDQLPGWSFKPSKPKDGMTYNQFEGYYPDKGGKLISARIKLDKQPGEFAYFKVKFEAQARERAYQGIDFYDAAGNPLPDCYDVVYPGGRCGYERVFYAMGNVDSCEVFFQSTSGISAWNLSVERTTVEAAAAYCDRVYAGLKPIGFSAPADAMKLLPKTREAIGSGRKFHVVLLGDSIMQDTFHSQFHALFKREFPKSNFTWTISMRGGTGCWYYCQDKNFKSYVADAKPDLLIIGGISNFRENMDPTGAEAMRIVAGRARKELGCEVLILSNALALDIRLRDGQPGQPVAAREFVFDHPDWADKYGSNFRATETMASQNDFPFWDMFQPCYRWLYSTGEPFEFFSRDRVHSGEKGKQIIGRVVLEYFKSVKNFCL